jgi:virginiamycin B lyase
MVSNFTDPSISAPNGITLGPDGALWFTNNANNSIGRITTAGSVTSYTDATISGSGGIAVGSDGALWFTNFRNGSIGRITTAGRVTNYTDASINIPDTIAPGPDGALWFTNHGNGSIGRITTTVTPGINLLTPTSGPKGTTVTITGRNLAGAIQVEFNGTPTSIVSNTATQIVTKVPAGAATGPITVTVSAGTATSNGNFIVT